MRNPFRRKSLSASDDALEMLRLYGGGYYSFPRSAFVDEAFIFVQQAAYTAIYELQPNVRTVIDYIAAGVIQPSLHLYRFMPNGDREDAGDHPAAETMRQPNDWQGQRELLEAWAKDFLIYENAYLWKVGNLPDGRVLLLRVPPYSIGVKGDNIFDPATYRIMFRDGKWKDVGREQIIHWRGYSPGDPRIGASRMETLRTELAAEAARKARETEFIRGGMVKGGFIKRPIEAPEWSSEARERFEADMAQRVRGIASGKTPVLEESMDFVDAGVSPKDAELIRSRELSLATVARVYGLSPIVFDTALGGSSSGGIREARLAAEQDTFSPLGQHLAETLNVQLLGDTYDDRDEFYFEFSARRERDLQKLYEAGSRATGGPFLTINEFRRDLNKPPLDGGDEIITPLNVTRGGGSQPNPSAVGDSDERGRPAENADMDFEMKQLGRVDAKLKRRDAWASEHEKLLRRHFNRQRRALEGKSVAQLDKVRWDDELATDLHRLAKKVVREEGALTAERMMGSFDDSQVENYLKAGAVATAGAINAQTARDARQAVERGEEAVHALQVAAAARAPALAAQRATQLVSFATFEAGKQNERPGEVRLKRWVWSGKANSRHSGLAGVSVPLGGSFPNGAAYPGDPDLGAEQNANCGCSLDIL